MKETELYQPVKKLLEDLGYEVTSEVKSIDVVATKNNNLTTDLIIVELKTSFTMKLIFQAIERQKITNNVYIAIPRPKYKKKFGKDFKAKRLLLRRLGLGLIFVSTENVKPYAQIVFEPTFYDLVKSQSQNKRKKEAVLEEIKKRHGDNNLGGTKEKIITAYREDALLIASYLEENGAMSSKDLQSFGTSQNTYRILYTNHYQWFERVSKGIYALSEIGIKEIDNYRHIIKLLR